MSNNFNIYTAEQVGEVTIGLAKESFRLASVVTAYGEESFQPGRGSTVFLNVPGGLTAHSRKLDETSLAIILDSLTESREPVSLATHAYSAVALSEQDLSLDLVDFTRQVLAPQADAVADKVESAIEAVLASVPVTASSFDETDPVRVFTAGRSALRARGIDVAASDLVAVVGSDVVDHLLDSGALDFGKTGAPDALRNGSLGRIRGFDTIESGRIEPSEIVFMTRSALYLAHRAPVVPVGATYGAKVSAKGFSMRYIRDYDVTTTKDRSLVSTFVGAGVLPLYKVDRTHDNGTQGDAGFTAGTATVTEVPGGAVVKVNTAA